MVHNRKIPEKAERQQQSRTKPYAFQEFLFKYTTHVPKFDIKKNACTILRPTISIDIY